MGKQVNSYFIGRKDNIVGSSWKGMPYFRFQPDTIYQTKPMVASSNLLGFCSTMGKAFRREFEDVIHLFKGKNLENRLTGVLKKWMQAKPFDGNLPTANLPFINEFQFNEMDSLHDRLHCNISIQQKQQQLPVLHIPAFKPAQAIAAPAYTTQVYFSIVAACYHVAGKSEAGNHHIQFTIPYTNTTVQEQNIVLPFQLPGNSLTLVVIGLRYTALKNGNPTLVADKRWMPCGVAAGLAT